MLCWELLSGLWLGDVEDYIPGTKRVVSPGDLPVLRGVEESGGMMIEIHAGVKAYWVGIFFALLILEGLLKIIAGVFHADKQLTYTLSSAAYGLIAVVVGVGWWFAE